MHAVWNVWSSAIDGMPPFRTCEERKIVTFIEVYECYKTRTVIRRLENGSK